MKHTPVSGRVIIGLLIVTLGIMLLLDTTNALGPDTAMLGTY